MRELWWLIQGFVRLRLTGADPERTLRLLMRTARLERIERRSQLVVEFTVSSTELKAVASVAEKNGDRLEVLHRGGLPELVRSWLRRPLICLTVLVLVWASLWVPGRVLLFQVEGNETIPERRILEAAAEAGLCFGADRGAVRSEQIKNRLLDVLPELSWVGVNTQGCVARISVQERQRSPEEQTVLPGNIVASVDGIVTSVTATSGTTMCTEGEGVRAGQVLISGYTDLGLCTHVEAAEGEVYARTSREITAVVPRQTAAPGAQGEIVKKYSLLLGKNRINFYSDSGILYTGCGKMTQIRVLSLPGGWTLPAALIVEQYSVSETVPMERPAEEAEAMLVQAARAELEQTMIAGEIRSAETVSEDTEDTYRLKLLCRCHEMIGRRSTGIQTEGDANDGENGERGTG